MTPNPTIRGVMEDMTPRYPTKLFRLLTDLLNADVDLKFKHDGCDNCTTLFATTNRSIFSNVSDNYGKTKTTFAYIHTGWRGCTAEEGEQDLIHHLERLLAEVLDA